jgi:hypothetical protein
MGSEYLWGAIVAVVLERAFVGYARTWVLGRRWDLSFFVASSVLYSLEKLKKDMERESCAWDGGA